MVKKALLITLFLLFSSGLSNGETNKINIHPGTGVDNIKLNDNVEAVDKNFGKYLFIEEVTEKSELKRGFMETRFYSYKNSVLGVKIALTEKLQKQYKKLHKSAKSNFIEANGAVSEIKVIPLLGNISIRGIITSKSSLNDVLTAFGPLNLKITDDGRSIKCFTSTIDPSPFNSGEHVMAINYLNDGIKFEFLIAEKNMLTTITVGKVAKCKLVSEIETF